MIYYSESETLNYMQSSVCSLKAVFLILRKLFLVFLNILVIFDYSLYVTFHLDNFIIPRRHLQYTVQTRKRFWREDENITQSIYCVDRYSINSSYILWSEKTGFCFSDYRLLIPRVRIPDIKKWFFLYIRNSIIILSIFKFEF